MTHRAANAMVYHRAIQEQREKQEITTVQAYLHPKVTIKVLGHFVTPQTDLQDNQQFLR